MPFGDWLFGETCFGEACIAAGGPVAGDLLKRSEYKLVIRDLAGVKQAIVTDFLQLAYAKRVNEPGLASVLLRGDHSLLGLIEHRWQVEVWRRNQFFEVDWYTDFEGLYMKARRPFTDRSMFGLVCVGYQTMLNWRWVLWKAGLTNQSTFANRPAETIMKTLVGYNLGASATAVNGRERDGTLTGISVQTDGGGGNSLDWNCAWKPVMGELQRLARVAGGDFDLVKTGAATWEFRWYLGQRGDDLTGDVKFSLGRGNMANPVYEYDRIGEVTVMAVGGDGPGQERQISIRTGPDYSAANDIEGFVDARNTKTPDGRAAVGDRRLDELQARERLGFDVLQTPSTFYGKHYCIDGQLGDLVAAEYLGLDWTQKIVGVNVACVAGGGEQIGVEMETQ